MQVNVLGSLNKFALEDWVISKIFFLLEIAIKSNFKVENLKNK